MADPTDLLRQDDQRQLFERLGTGAWTIVYKSWHDDDDSGALFSALSPPKRRQEAVKDPSWDLSIGNGQPGFMQSFHPRKRTKYLRFGDDTGVEPLVLTQEHWHMKPPMLPQVSEEFRLYHNLWLSPDGTKLLKIETSGAEYEAGRITYKEVQLRTNLIRQYQAGRQLDLLLFIDSVRFVHGPKPAGTDGLNQDTVDATRNISFHVGDRPINGRPFSRIFGTKVLPPPPLAKAGIWPYDQREEEYIKFVIGEDDMGSPTSFACDPDLLGNYFGANLDAPHYLTPVFFTRDVLQRYYEQPEKFSVDDGYLRCGGLWGLRIDNDHPHHVMVFLGDLGRDLPESERSYWKAFNVSPSGAMSETVYRRSFLGQFTDPEAPDLSFKNSYRRFNANWLDSMGWPLFKPLEPADKHVLQRLRVPLNGSQPEFEDQILGLTKVLVDALNEAGVSKRLGNRVEGERGIEKLRRWLEKENYPDVERDIALLKRLQRLRSRMAAHRKGSDYDQMLKEEGVNGDPAREIAMVMVQASRMLSSFAEHFDVSLDYRSSLYE